MKRWRVWVGTLTRLLQGKERLAGALPGGSRGVVGVICLAVAVGACAPRMPNGGGMQGGDLSLDLPLEPAAPVKQRPPLPVQTTPPLLGSGGLPPGGSTPARAATQSPVKEFGIPARSVGHGVQAPASATQKARPSVQKKKKSTAKKAKTPNRKRKTVKKKTSPCPCVQPGR
ncbi:MAG: hypothetical protein HQL88_00410 [Magnetococcales bacterium]|nr:hypothetical protein [Magnetococcales bacterium]